jgi:hypothetical protein
MRSCISAPDLDRKVHRLDEPVIARCPAWIWRSEREVESEVEAMDEFGDEL